MSGTQSKPRRRNKGGAADAYPTRLPTTSKSKDSTKKGSKQKHNASLREREEEDDYEEEEDDSEQEEDNNEEEEDSSQEEEEEGEGELSDEDGDNIEMTRPKEKKKKTRKRPPPVYQNKSMFITYLLWMTTGLFGTHHLYLGRERHAALWASTLGGFGLGWIRDFWMIPEYVNEVNGVPAFNIMMKAKIKAHPQPTISFVRHIGIIIISGFIGNVFSSCLDPATTQPVIRRSMQMVGQIFGTILVASVGFPVRLVNVRHYIRTMVIVSSLMVIVEPIGDEEESKLSLIFTFVNNWAIKRTLTWDLFADRPGSRKLSGFTLKKLVIYITITGIVGGAFLSGVYHNLDEETKADLRSFGNVTSTLAWSELKEYVDRFFVTVRDEGVLTALYDLFDSSGVSRAFRTLGLSKSASEKDVRQAYRKLSLKYHPDRHPDDPVAARNMLKINEAYGFLKKEVFRGR